MYADDSHLFFTGNTIDAAITLAMTKMKKVTLWFHCNRLSLNVNKTKYLIFNHNIPRIIEDQPLNLLIDSVKIEQVTSAIFLGFTIQSNLKWDEHIHNICKKISMGIGIMKKLRKCLPTTFLFTIYYSHIIYISTSNSWHICVGTNNKEKSKQVKNPSE